MRNKLWANMTVGASSKKHWADRAKVLDGFHTPRKATLALLRHEQFHRNIWEPANGFGRISKVLESKGHRIFTSDIFRWHSSTQAVHSFMDSKRLPFKDGDIITNPPFVKAADFVKTAMRLLRPGAKLAMILRLQFLEGIKRHAEVYAKYPPRTIYIFSYRLPRMHRFKFKGKKGTSALAFAWFVWEKGFTGRPEVVWITR